MTPREGALGEAKGRRFDSCLGHQHDIATELGNASIAQTDLSSVPITCHCHVHDGAPPRAPESPSYADSMTMLD